MIQIVSLNAAVKINLHSLQSKPSIKKTSKSVVLQESPPPLQFEITSRFESLIPVQLLNTSCGVGRGAIHGTDLPLELNVNIIIFFFTTLAFLSRGTCCCYTWIRRSFASWFTFFFWDVGKGKNVWSQVVCVSCEDFVVNFIVR